MTKNKVRTRIGIITQYAQYHIRSAKHMATKCFQAEESFKNNPENNPYYSHKAYVTSSILLSVAFLEARINEFFILPFLNSNPWNLGQISNEKYQGIKSIGQFDGYKKLSTMDKYQLGLSILETPSFETGKNPYQDAYLLIQLRNALIHFYPESMLLIPENNSEEHRLVKALKGKFCSNPIAISMKRNNFPDLILGYGCSKWSVITSLALVKEFDTRVGLSANYYDIADNLP